jgi:hypothetical protein
LSHTYKHISISAPLLSETLSRQQHNSLPPKNRIALQHDCHINCSCCSSKDSIKVSTKHICKPNTNCELPQLLFAAVILALSVVMINGYGPGHAPSLLDYGAFCGAAGLIFAVAGIGAIFIEALQGIITLALDGIACFFLLAGAAVSTLCYQNKHSDVSNVNRIRHSLLRSRLATVPTSITLRDQFGRSSKLVNTRTTMTT